MTSLRHYLKVFLVNIRLSVMVALEYPANLAGWALSNPIQFIVGFATIKFVVSEFGTINGWGYEQLAFLYGIAVISHALSMIFFIQGWFMGYYVVEGDFDTYMLRPMSVLFQFFFTNINIVGITDLIPGICVFAYGCIKVGFEWNLLAVVELLSLIIGATLIRGGIYIAMGTLTFWTKSTNQFAMFTQEFFDKTTMYPITMYPKVLQFILTFIIPIGWVSFYPAGEMLNMKGMPLSFSGMPFVTLGVGIAVLLLASAFFKTGLKRYESAGH